MPSWIQIPAPFLQLASASALWTRSRPARLASYNARSASATSFRATELLYKRGFPRLFALDCFTVQLYEGACLRYRGELG